MKLLLLRDGKQLSVPVTIELMKEGDEEDAAVTSDKLGVKVAELGRERGGQPKAPGSQPAGRGAQQGIGHGWGRLRL